MLVDDLVFVEGKEDVEILTPIINKSSTKIISFDFEAHKKLESLGIKHFFVEEYITKQDELDIDNKTVELTTKWYLHPTLIKYLEYGEINFGSLLEIEIIWYFFEYLKRIIGIIRIIENEKPKKIFVSFLSDCTKSICDDKPIEIIKQKSQKNVVLFFDSIEIPIGICGKVITIKISRKNFQRVKKILGLLVNRLYNTKPNFHELKTKKAILLLDYNPVHYEYLLQSLSDSKYDILLLNQRRPAIWNYNSLQIIKNSKCKLIELNDFSNDKIKLKIQKEIEQIKIKLEKLWGENEAFNEIFCLNGYPFWNAIKINFSNLINARIVESVERSILLDELFGNLNISCMLEWAHVGLEDKMIISKANTRKIPNMFLQHGMFLQNENFHKYIPILPLLPLNGSKHLVWGKILEDFILKQGIQQDKIIAIGSPRHDKFFKNFYNKNSNTILIAANGFFHNNCQGTDTRAFIRMENFIRKIFETMKKYPDKKLIVKLHPGKVPYDIKPLLKEIAPDIEIYQNENILDLLEDCDSMISLNYSTVFLDAMILQKPTLVLLPENQNYETEIPIKTGALLSTSDENQIESLINNLLFNKDIRDKLVQNGNNFVNDYITNQGNASEKLAEILESYCSNKRDQN